MIFDNAMTNRYNELATQAIDALPSETPQLIHDYLRKGAKKELRLSKKTEDQLYIHLVSLSGVFGYRDTLRHLCEAFLIREATQTYPSGGNWRAYTATLAWSTRRLFLSGYADLFNKYTGSQYDLRRRIGCVVINPSAVDVEEYGTPESPGSMWESMGELVIQNLLLEIEHATYPWLSGAPNSFNWSRTDFEHHMEATARFLRAHLGMPEQIETFEPDPVVILPEGFTGFTIDGQPAPPSAVPYTPPVPTVYLPAGTDPAVIAHHRNTTPTPATPTPSPTPAATADPPAAPQEHTIPAPEPTSIPAEADITPYWQAVEHHLGDHANEVLNPPATEEDITRLETTLGLTLPTQLRASLARHNGMAAYPEDDFPGEILLSCAEIIDHYETWQHVFEDLTDDTAEFNLTGDTGLTLPGFWNPGWIPITDDGTGNALVIDTTPGPNGTIGQILSIVTDGASEGLIYPNLATMLNSYATKITDHRNTTTQP